LVDFSLEGLQDAGLLFVELEVKLEWHGDAVGAVVVVQ
jgi:hypothetical protein